MATDDAKSNFIRQIIDEDLERGVHQQVVTRFPPEPNGYLHIGHAKSICLNYGIARDYARRGVPTRFHLRFDDTNPTTEETEYVDSIKADVAWLGAKWGENLFFASDYFERMYELACRLIERGKAYVDSQDVEAIRAGRGSLTEPGTDSPYRERGVEENLDLFRRMRAGEFEDGAHVLRAKIDMSNPNMLMRDPLLYRIRHAHHHRTADTWCIYPMYDFAHALEDAFEGVTHSICTLEFENNRELYDWVVRETEVCGPADEEGERPQQIEFARLNLGFTVMSKRKLLQLVREGRVSGWDDPRMPTLAGLRRRGVTADALWDFTDRIGVAKANSTVDIGLLEHSIRDDLNTKAPRVMCVHDPLKVVITNYEGDEEWLDASYWPRDVPKEGSRQIPFSRELWIERDDFMEDPPKGYYRLSPGAEVRLRYGYFITCDEVVKDDAGEVVELRCSYDPATRGGASPDGRKVRGTIHWVSAKHALPCELRIYDRLFRVEKPEAGGADFLDNLNEDSLQMRRGFIEPSVADDAPETRYQFERQGYYWRDPKQGRGEELVFNRVVSLKDSWARQQAKEQPSAPKKAADKKTEAKKPSEKKERPNKRPASYERDKAREADAELAARLERYQDQLELPYDDADLLSGSQPVARFFEAALQAYDSPKTVASWVVNELLPRLGEEESPADLRFGPAEVATVVRMFDEGRITNQISQQVLEAMLETGDDPETIVAREGLETIQDSSELEAIVDEILAANEENVQRYAEGKRNLLGFFIGAVMRQTGGTADPRITRELLTEKLPDPDS